jgi:hypothetical protein
MLKRKSHPNQFTFDLDEQTPLERMIEARVAVRAERDAIRWRFRLIVIETVMIASLVLVAGFVLKQPAALVLRGALIVGGGCFASGIVLIGLSGLTGNLLTIYRLWRAR